MRKVTEAEIEKIAIKAANRYAGKGSRLADKGVMRERNKLAQSIREKTDSDSCVRLALRIFERRLLELATAQRMIGRPNSIRAGVHINGHHRVSQSGGNH